MPAIWPQSPAPQPRRDATTRTQHGETRPDPYAWLRDANWQDVVVDPGKLSADIAAHLNAENEHVESLLADTKALQDTLITEMRGRMVENEESVPVRDKDWFYGERFAEGAEHPLFTRYPVGADNRPDKSRETVLLDADALSERHDFFDLGDVAHSPDHRKLAWSVDTKGAENYRIFIKDLGTGEVTDTGIADAEGALIWVDDNESFLWMQRDREGRTRMVRRHRLGDDPSQDEVIFENREDGMFLSLGGTADETYAVLARGDHDTSECWLWPLSGAGELTHVLPRVDGVEYSVEHHDGVLTVLANANDARDFALWRMPVDCHDLDQAEILVPHRPGVLILSQAQFDGFHVRMERENALPRIVVRDEKSGEEHNIEFDEAAYALGLHEVEDYNIPVLRFSVSSPTRPSRVFDYDMRSRERVLRKETEIPSGHDPRNYVCERRMATVRDGETVPVTLLRRTDANQPGPLLLYGYGAYGISMPAGFSGNRLSLVDRGVTFAIAHVRGGKEKGYAWYEAGRMEHKENSFNDFVDVAKFLIAEGYTAKGQIVAQGGSAGGLLMGAVANQAPELFAGILAQVPFTDVLTTMSDASLRLTPPEWPEWGNPIEDLTSYQRMKGYCPVTNVAQRPYPPVFATAGISDTRVTWWEPAKWIASLRYAAPDAGPYLLRTEMSAGHSGNSGRFAYLKEVAEEQAFVLKCFGLT